MTFRANILPAVLLLALTSPAAAFDCGKARTEVEKAICADPDLKRLDDDLGEAYAEVKGLSTRSEQKMLARAQKDWIASREQCGTSPDGLEACIRKETQERLALFAGEPESGPGTGSRLIPVFVRQEGSETVYDLDIQLYRFAAPATPGEKAFNAITQEHIDRLKMGPHGEETDGRIYAIEEGMTLSYASPQFLSVLNSFWADTGGAHGNGGVENFNLDITTGEPYQIMDFFGEEAAAELAKDCKAQIIARKKENLEDYDPQTDDFLKDEIIGEHIATLSRWTFEEGQATVSFDAYAIGSYAEGAYECVFPTAQLKEIAIPGAPLP